MKKQTAPRLTEGKKKDSLSRVGFTPVGDWKLRDGKLDLCLLPDEGGQYPNALYAFISGDYLLYVGKTTDTLRSRLARYLKPYKSQGTNIRNNGAIRDLLSEDQEVKIWALPDRGLHRYGEFEIHLAAALEDSIIEKLKPAWNGTRSKNAKDDENTPDQPKADADDVASDTEETGSSASTPSFTFVLQKEYYKRGFFNVSVKNQHFFGSQKGSIDIYCGSEKMLVKGRLDRTSNANHTPRINGNAPLRNWFQENFEPMQLVAVKVIGPTSIELTKEAP